MNLPLKPNPNAEIILPSPGGEGELAGMLMP
jgi:hypothetical protein